jgi:hypothetical protein
LLAAVVLKFVPVIVTVVVGLAAEELSDVIVGMPLIVTVVVVAHAEPIE